MKLESLIDVIKNLQKKHPGGESYCDWVKTLDIMNIKEVN